MGKDFEVEGRLSFEAGDMSGVDAVEGFRKTAAKAQAELEHIKKSGSLNAFGIGVEAVQAAQAEFIALATQTTLLEKQLVGAQLEFSTVWICGGWSSRTLELYIKI